MARASAIIIVALASCLAGCPGEPRSVPSCEDVGVGVEPATAPDRRLLGLASPYPGDGMLAGRMDELRTSQQARRAAAWEVVARVLAPIALTEPTPVDGASIPRFRTWYDRDDLARIFGSAYEDLGPAGRAVRARFAEAALDDAFGANLRTLDGSTAWTEARWTAYVAALDDDALIAGVGGLRRIAMSPDAARHVARSYPEILRCLADGSPPAFVDGPPESSQRLTREPIVLSRCASRTVGPFYVASGARLEAHLEGAGASVATLRVLAGTARSTATERCAAASELGCEAEGPGALFVEIAAGGLAVDAMLDVAFTAPDVPIAGCLDGVFPLGAATVAAEWRRVELGPLPTYDTSAEGLARHLPPGLPATWGEGDGSADPGAEAIYTLRLPGGGSFRLAGLHIRTRELEHWMNITLWWSARPDEDFGADRPDAVRALGGPWSSYAMCVAIDDVEGDADPSGHASEPSLAAALAAVHEGAGGATWCSNPYIDAAPGLARTNCVGCHQHAMSGVHPGEVVMDEARFPATGRLFVRNNVPGDQFWGLDAGDDLATLIADTVAYWDTAAP